MKKLSIATLLALFSVISCQISEPEVLQPAQQSTIKCNMSASMPEFKSGGDLDTKSSLESVVRVKWNQGDELSVINLTTGKQLGGCIKADNTGANTTFSPYGLTGTINNGDHLVFLLDNEPSRRSASERDFESFTMDFSTQNGNADDVPIVVYADYTATQDGVIDAINPAFNFLMGYVQLGISALPASTSVSELGIENLNTACQFSIVNNAFVPTPQNGNLRLTQSFNANSKGANTRYFSCFTSPAQGSARNAHIIANAESHITAWLKAALSAGYYYQSVATGFTNENVQFVDPTFKSYCVSHYDLNGDGELSFAEAAAITSYAPFTAAEKASIEAVFELPYFPAELGIPSFEGCTALERISLPGTLTAIPDNEFKGCTSLNSIVIPNNVTSIGVGAFEGCTSLQYFNSALATADKQFLVYDEHLLAFAPAGHYYVTIPDAVRVINEGVFRNCTSVRSLQLNYTGRIEDSAFYGCTSLLSLNLVSWIEYLGDEAFYGCENLATVYSQNATPPTLGNDVFSGCSSELKILVSESVKDSYDNSPYWNSFSIYSRVWNKIYYTTTDGQPLTFNGTVYAPEGGLNTNYMVSNEYVNGQGVLTFLKDIANLESDLIEQSRLTSLTLPDCMQSMPWLKDCYNLETVNIPDGISDWYIFSQKFEGCSKLREFSGANVTDDGLLVIHDGILSSMVKDSPSEITIPSYVTTIDEYAFIECTKLTKVTILDNVKEIGLQAFRLCPIEEYYFTSMTPPYLSGDEATFWFNPNKASLIFVPFAAVDTYKTAGILWEPYRDYITGY